MRAIAIIVILLGIASIVFGVLFITQSSDAKQEVADSIAPLPLDQLDDAYDAAKADAVANPTDIGKTIKKTGLGLARANAGAAKAVMYNGIVDIILGAGLVLGGLALSRKSSD